MLLLKTADDAVTTDTAEDGLKEPYVLIVHPGQERQTVQRLNDRGYRAYSPSLYKRVRLARGRTADVLRPLFPCYAFADMANHYDWRGVEAVKGVWRFLTLAGRPASLSQVALDAIKVKEADLHARWLAQRRTTNTVGLEVGQTVMVRVGPFADMLGQIERFDAKGRAEVLLTILGAERAVLVACAELVAA